MLFKIRRIYAAGNFHNPRLELNTSSLASPFFLHEHSRDLSAPATETDYLPIVLNHVDSVCLYTRRTLQFVLCNQTPRKSQNLLHQIQPPHPPQPPSMAFIESVAAQPLHVLSLGNAKIVTNNVSTTMMARMANDANPMRLPIQLSNLKERPS